MSLQKSTVEQTSPKRLKEKNVKVTPKVNHRLSRAMVKVTRLKIDANEAPSRSHNTRNARVADFKNQNVMTRNRLTVDRIKSPTQRIAQLKKVAPKVDETNGNSSASSRSSSRKSSISSNMSSPRQQNGKSTPPIQNGRRSARSDSVSSAPSTPTTRRKQVQNGPTKSIASKSVNGLKRDRPAMIRNSTPSSDGQSHSDTHSPQPKRKASGNVADKSPPPQSRSSSLSRRNVDTSVQSVRSSSVSTGSAPTKTTASSTVSSSGIRGRKILNHSLPVVGKPRLERMDRSLPNAKMSLRKRK